MEAETAAALCANFATTRPQPCRSGRWHRLGRSRSGHGAGRRPTCSARPRTRFSSVRVMPEPHDSPLALALRDDALERFLRYARIDTQSARDVGDLPEHAEAARPLAAARRRAARARARRRRADRARLRLRDAAGGRRDDGPTVGLSRTSTRAPTRPATGVDPQVWRDYDGGELVLPGDPVLSPATSALLAERVGHDIVTSDGTTLLGADDKAGVAEIMAAVAWLVAHPEVPRARARIALHGRRGGRPRHRPLRPRALRRRLRLHARRLGRRRDRERDVLGDRAEGDVPRRRRPPRHARRASSSTRSSSAARFVASLPPDTLSPETTEGREGFVHPYRDRGRRRRGDGHADPARPRRRRSSSEHEALVRRLAEEAVAGRAARERHVRALGSVPQHARGARPRPARGRGGARGDAAGRARADARTRSAAAPTARG